VGGAPLSGITRGEKSEGPIRTNWGSLKKGTSTEEGRRPSIIRSRRKHQRGFGLKAVKVRDGER